MINVLTISLLIIFANIVNCHEPTFAYDFDFVSPYNHQANPISFNHTNIISAVKQNDYQKLASYKSYFETRNSTDQHALLQNIDFDSLKLEVRQRLKEERLKFQYRPQTLIISLFIYISLIKQQMTYRLNNVSTNYSTNDLRYLINEDFFLLGAAFVGAYMTLLEYKFLPIHQTIHYLNYFEARIKTQRQLQ